MSSGIWWDDEDYPELKPKFDEAQAILSANAKKKISAAQALAFLIDHWKKTRRN